MRRAALAIVSTIAGLVLLLSFKTQSSSSRPPAMIGSANPGTDTTTPPATTKSSSTKKSSGSSAAATGTRTVTGTTVDTQWGPVQVQLTVRNGKITKIALVQYPNGNPRDQEINSYAVPQLIQETMAAQSAKIDTISGATVTSDGYIGSLQSALNKAGL